MQNKVLLIIVAAGAVILFGTMLSYNGLINMNENVNGKWSQIENQLQRRIDLIPNLINTVKGFAAHEQQAIVLVTEARSKLSGAKGPAAKATANNNLNSAVSRLLVVAERYPDLKADQNFRALMDELSGTENRIAVARKDYNDAIQGYNTQIRSFPTSMIAGIMSFGPKEYFKADEAAKQVPQVKF